MLKKILIGLTVIVVVFLIVVVGEVFFQGGFRLH